MWNPRHSTSSSTSTSIKKGGGNGLVAVAIDKDKGSQFALKWAVENLLGRGQTVVLVHVLNKPPPSCLGLSQKEIAEKLNKDLFLTFHCYCTRKDIHSLDIVLEDTDVVKALTEYVSYAAIGKLVLGAPSRSGFMRKFRTDTPSCVSKASPDFCTVYIISKGKVSSVRNASRSAPHASPLLEQINKLKEDAADRQSLSSSSVKSGDGKSMTKPRISIDSGARSPYHFPRTSQLRSFEAASQLRSFGEFSETESSDISFVSSDRPSTDRTSSLYYDSFIDSGRTSRVSTSTDQSLGSMRLGIRWTDRSSNAHDFSSVSQESGRSSSVSSNLNDDVEAEMRRLRLELKQTMDMYSNACREALSAKQQVKEAMELKNSKHQEEQKLHEARQAEQVAMSTVEKERAKCKAAVQAAEAAQKLAESEPSRRPCLEVETLRETLEMKKMLEHLSKSNIKYRRYSIDEIEKATDGFDIVRKIGEGGYGPVYRCNLDHTSVAVKVLRPDAAQGRLQFLQELEVLSCIRHPHMVLLLGACPEYGILVYEYMAKGSLDDRLFRRGNTPVLPWQLRFRIAAEIATGLLFLHQTKPEPIVHRDLKPGNILLDHNYVSKISDVGLARLVPAVAENVTQCRITSTAGTFCYIDPEYQQTGMLGTKSDVYSLGILLLQIITAKPPMGLAHYSERALEKGTFLTEMLDPAVTDWPAEETLSFAKLSLQCAELRRKDRPDLATAILPELSRLRDIADEQMNQPYFAHSAGPSPNHSQTSISPSQTSISSEKSDPQVAD